jgi:hypothetical protein
MVQLTDSTTIVAAEDTLSTTLDGESVILHTESEQYFGFNEVGTDLWELVAEPRSIAELTEAIAADYDVTVSECRADIEAHVEAMLAEDLVRVVED